MSYRLDLSRFAGSDSEGEDEIPKRQLELTALKSKTFSHGITKKTRKDLEKEAEEKKRQEEEEAAIRVMAQFQEEFEGPAERSSSNPNRIAGPGGVRAFRGRPMAPGGGFVRAGGAPMAPTGFHKPIPSGPAGNARGPPRGPAAMYPKPLRPVQEEPTQSSGVPKPKGKRAMDSFLEEIKSNQNAREQRLGHLAQKEGSSISALAAWESNSTGGVLDMETTNLFTSNLPLQGLTEESLGLHFARLGPVATVKIMWPRGDELQNQNPQFRRGLSGFVSYMTRKDAEKAVRELDGSDFLGNTLKVGWSKAVPRPRQALFDVTTKSKRDRSTSRDRYDSRRQSPTPSASPPRKRRYSSRSYSSDSYSHSRSHSPRRKSDKEKWMDSINPEQRKFIETVAKKVKEHGKGFENLLREKERENSKFSFLVNDALPDYHFFLSCLSSSYRIPVPPAAPFEDEGYASMYSSDSAEDSEKERAGKGKLGKLARRRFEAMLRSMSGKRGEIGRGMEFALMRAEAAEEVADIICQSLTIDSTPVPRKMARLHLISDILHNSASHLPNVWRYRPAFEHCLPPIFAHFHTVYQSLLAYKGNISADVFKAHMENVLHIWEKWIVFTSDTSDLFRALLAGTKSISQLEKTPQGNWIDKKEREAEEERRKKEEVKKEESKEFKTSGFKSSFKPITVGQAIPASSTGAPMAGNLGADLDGEPMEDLDGEEMDLDGEAMEDLDGEAMEDLDGEAM